VRKIISILVALGLVLSFSVMATPVSAAVSNVTVDVHDSDCACLVGTYNITFNITADLDGGWDTISVKFPDGTTVPATFATGDITVNGEDVFGGEVDPVVDNTVTFLVPKDVDEPGPVEVIFTHDAGIKNPCVAGTDKTVWVNTSRDNDSTPVESADYTIRPALSTYAFVVDFGPTYPGIAEDFVPPFKMCGQNDTDQPYAHAGMEFDTVYNASIPGWLTVFNFTFESDVVGCDTPCANVTIWAELTACPVDETMTLGFNGTWFSLTAANLTDVIRVFDNDDIVLYDGLPLTNPISVTWNASLHFSSPGKYEWCVYAECPAVAAVCPDCEEADPIIAERCFKFSVYQWKEAYKIPLYHKWNLISLPLVLLVDPPISTLDKTGVLDAYANLDAVVSVWYYDRTGCPTEDPLGTWEQWPIDPNMTMEDGKAYWIRIAYNSTPGFQMGDPADGLWVWGTLKPVPPDSPSAYPVCDGWNMIGFTSMVPMLDGAYLWNFPFGVGGYGAVYGWWAPTQSWWLASPNAIQMDPGEGFWASFDGNGTIYPP